MHTTWNCKEAKLKLEFFTTVKVEILKAYNAWKQNTSEFWIKNVFSMVLGEQMKDLQNIEK